MTIERQFTCVLAFGWLLWPRHRGGLRAARSAGQAWACPLFLVPGAAVVSGVKGSPQGCRAQRDAQHPWGRRGGPVACAARQEMSGGEAASFSVLLGPRSGLARVITSPGRAVAEQGLAVIAAEQEGEPVQVLAQLADVVGGVTAELAQGDAEAPPIAGQPLAEELQQLGELGRVHDVQPDFGHRGHRLPGRGCAA